MPKLTEPPPTTSDRDTNTGRQTRETSMKALLFTVTRIAFALSLIITALEGMQRFAMPVASAATGEHRVLCDDGAPLCTETVFNHNYEGRYIGHDEPALLFYSNTPGSGNSSR